jgi:predicted nucleotidyltransferase
MIDSDQKDLKFVADIIRAVLGDNIEIYAYGSRTKGETHRGSDLDIMLKAPQKLDFAKVLETRDMLTESHLPYRVDLHDYHATDQSFLDTISKDFIKL